MTVPKPNKVGFMLLVLPLLVSACASAPRAASPGAAASAAPQAGAGAKMAAKAPQKPALPDVELTDDLLFRFLVGEVALQRGRPDIAAQTYLDLARSTRDPRVARRAAQIAYETRQIDKAIEAFELWVELEPDSRPAQQMLIALLLNTGRLEEARPWLAKFIAADPSQAGALFRQLVPVLAHNANKDVSLQLVRDLAQPYPKLPEAHLAVAQVAAAAGRQDDALAEVRQALALRPDWDDAVMFEVQLLRARPDQAAAELKRFLAANPSHDEVRLVYARVLIDRKQYREARDEFQRLLAAHPDNADLAFTVAVLSMQLGDLGRAEKELQEALKNGKKDKDTVEYYLGQLSESKKDSQGAIQHYEKVRGGDYLYPARLREAYLLAQSGKLAAARDLLHHVRAEDSQQQVQVVLLEGEILRDARQYQESYRVLQQGLKKFPDDPDLLYEAAMAADKLDKPDVMETLIRKLISLQPDNANAYNALGYSFLERNVRTEEGMRLVEKAYELAPNDAAIIDSVGWGHYRQGRIEQSLEFLRRAYQANPDPEIAAHLGEVLWVHGDKDEARKVWQGALKEHPDSAPLQAAMKKFMK
jgi:tetratricopeptide (TPR) repeat protein